jgi:hypothetical protein
LAVYKSKPSPDKQARAFSGVAAAEGSTGFFRRENLKRAEYEDFFETDEFRAPSKGELNDFKNSSSISNAAIFSNQKSIL